MKEIKLLHAVAGSTGFHQHKKDGAACKHVEEILTFTA
jgi:hypothetical protein